MVALQRQRRMVVEMNRTRPKQIVIRVSEEELADRYGIGVTSKMLTLTTLMMH